MLAAVIFDVDGTLLDTERLYIQAWKQAGALLGYPMTDALMYSTRGRDGQTVQRLMAEALGEDFPYDEVRKLRVSLAEEAISRENDDEPMPNSVELRGLRSPVMKGNLPMNIDGKINKDN